MLICITCICITCWLCSAIIISSTPLCWYVFPFSSIDLRSELDIQTKVVAPDNSEGSPLSRIKATHPSTMSVGITTSPIMKNTPLTTPTRSNVAQPQPITPSARISALNMVGDLLRKVGVSLVRGWNKREGGRWKVIDNVSVVYMY